ncbi:hypothetical protein ABIE37_000559 [Arthrobacter bambusae]|uniref:Uncharacterized protein n=1 Tax=Arthrobacter bambusae TaxID=1338426 RepID=A0ABV2P217_9MICC
MSVKGQEYTTRRLPGIMAACCPFSLMMTADGGQACLRRARKRREVWGLP